MKNSRNPLEANSLYRLFLTSTTAVFLQVWKAASIGVPDSNCYALDNSSHVYDFSSWIGHPFEYEGKDSDLVVRFCKDVESRSQKAMPIACTIQFSYRNLNVVLHDVANCGFTGVSCYSVFPSKTVHYVGGKRSFPVMLRLSNATNQGYLDFGRFDKFNYFVAGSGHVDFVQDFYNGDLINCEHSYDKMGRTAQVNIICGSCPNGECKGGIGCICNVTYESACRVLVELAIPCKKQGLRVFEGFTVGFHPRSWELVYNGMTQLGFEKSHHEFSFKTEQSHVALYMTAIASLSNLVQKPTVKVSPEHGLEVRLSSSGASGSQLTTLSSTMLMVAWRCVEARDTPYEVDITVPVESYEPIQFTLTKMCEYEQHKEGNAMRGWAVFGVIFCIFIVFLMLFCCGGFVYKTRVQNQRGLDALPGMTILSACLETVSRGAHGYSRPEDVTSTFVNQASWEPQPVSAQGTGRTDERQ